MSVAGAALGKMAGKALGGGGGPQLPTAPNIGDYLTQANNYIDLNLQHALGYSENQMDQGRQALTDYEQKAAQAATDLYQSGFNTSQALQAPYRESGYAALDQYMDSLGIARPEMGSSAFAKLQENQAQYNAALANMKGIADENIQNMYTRGSYEGGASLDPEMFKQIQGGNNPAPTDPFWLQRYNSLFRTQNPNEQLPGYLQNRSLLDYIHQNVSADQSLAQGYNSTLPANIAAMAEYRVDPAQQAEAQKRLAAMTQAANLFHQANVGITPEQRAQALAYQQGNIGPARAYDIMTNKYV